MDAQPNLLAAEVHEPSQEAPPPARPEPRAAATTLGEVAGVLALVVVAALVYGWHLDRQGWANAYYAATAQAGATSWKSLLYGSVDAGNALATDKPPVGLWPMALSVRIFGLSSWSVIGPQLAESLAAVLLLVRTVRRHSGPSAGLVAGVVLAATPVFVVLARFDDPDTTVTLLSVGVAYTTLRYVEGRRRRWILWTGALFGLLFLTKWGAGLLVVPASVAAVFVSRTTTVRQEVGRLALAGGVAAAVAALWLQAVLLVPARRRPYEDASGGSLMNLVLGQNGLSRIVTRTPGGIGASAVSGEPGPFRLLQAPFAGQIGWFLPMAVALTLVLWVLSRGRRRGAAGERGPTCARLFWTSWLVATTLVFSVMSGPMHPYYTVLLAPAIAALTGSGLVDLRRAATVDRQRGAGVVLALVLAGSAMWALHVASPTVPTGALAVGAVPVLAAVGWATVRHERADPGTRRICARLVGPLAVVVVLAGPVAYSLVTVTHVVTGANPLAGPYGERRPVAYPPALVAFLRVQASSKTWAAVTPRATAASTLALAIGRPVLTLGGFTGHVPFPTLGAVRRWVRLGRVRYLVVAASPVATPSAAAGSPTEGDRVVTWARTHGCRVPVSEKEYVVVDLTGRACS